MLLSRVSLGKGCAERKIFSAISTNTKNNGSFELSTSESPSFGNAGAGCQKLLMKAIG